MPEYRPVWVPGDTPTSELAWYIINAWYNDIFMLPIIYGEPRIGKSVYALKVLNQVYDYIWGWDKWRVYEECLGFKPDEVLLQWKSLDRKIPGYIWDDAGCWLFTLDYQDPLLKEIQRYMNLLSTDIQCLILTTPDPRWILNKIGGMPGSKWIKILRKYSDYRHLGPWPDSVRFGRMAKLYNPFIAPDLKKTGVSKPRIQDEFSCRLDDDLYEYYKPRREHYATEVKKRMWEALSVRIKEDRIHSEKVKQVEAELINGIGYE